MAYECMHAFLSKLRTWGVLTGPGCGWLCDYIC